MKTKILLSALATFLFMNVTAFYNSSSLKINLENKRNTIYIIELEDGSAYKTYNDLHIDNLNNGLNRIKIFKQKLKLDKRQRGQRKQMSEKLIYDGVINIPANSTVFSQLVRRNLVVKNIVSKKVRRRHPAPNKRSRNKMNQREFNDLKRTVRHESFDSHKLDMMNFASRKNNLNSRQVLELMRLLTFDSYKLKFAKHAYDKTLDKKNYFIVADDLTFRSHKRDLMKYIRGRH